VASSRKQTRRPFRYRMDGSIRRIVMRAISWLALQSDDENPDLRSTSIKKILVVRANFRMGNAILALPAVAACRKTFPDATIDFLGSPISDLLFQQQPLNHHYVAPRRFPQVLWQYPRLMRRLRANRYDLAVDVSCSQSGAAAFVIALSGARIRAGLAGKWEPSFNLKIAKPRERNKYRKLTEFLGALNLERVAPVGSLKFSEAEKAAGRAKLESLGGKDRGKTVGVFVGGRKLRGKRWPLGNFAAVIAGLQRRGIRVIAFLGPEEKDIADLLRGLLDPSVPLVFEPSARKFAAIVAHLDLLICSDSGPMHLACAAGVRVVAIFQPRDVTRWSPPESAARVVCGPDDATAAMVLEAALEELALDRPDADSPAPPPPAAATAQD
jgi:lipopolysaccharide heptosyltransferase III